MIAPTPRLVSWTGPRILLSLFSPRISSRSRASGFRAKSWLAMQGSCVNLVFRVSWVAEVYDMVPRSPQFAGRAGGGGLPPGGKIEPPEPEHVADDPLGHGSDEP